MCLKKEDLPGRYHLKNHRRVMDIILVVDMPYTVLSQDGLWEFRESLPSATHDENTKRKIHALFGAQGPAFVPVDTVSTFQNIHVYELMAHLLDLTFAQNDGALDSVKVLLK